MNRFRSGSALFKNYATNSPTQQFDQAWANLRNVLMDISTIVLPPLTGGLQHFDDMLKTLQKILPGGDGAFGKAVGQGYGRGLATGSPVEALGDAAWGALKYWWGSDDQKKATKDGTKEGAKAGVEDALKNLHKSAFFGPGGGGPVLIPASYTTGGGSSYGNGVFYSGGGMPGGFGGRASLGGRNANPGGPVTTNPGVNPMGSLGGTGGFHVNFMHGQYGGPGANLATVSAGGKSFRVNAAAAPYLQGFVGDLAAAGAPINSVVGFNNRNIAGSSHLSQHAYGNAIDIDQHARNIVDPGLRAWAQKNRRNTVPC